MRYVTFALFCLVAGWAIGLGGYLWLAVGSMHSERGYSSGPILTTIFGLLTFIGPAVFWVIIPLCLLIKHRRTLGK